MSDLSFSETLFQGALNYVLHFHAPSITVFDDWRRGAGGDKARVTHGTDAWSLPHDSSARFMYYMRIDVMAMLSSQMHHLLRLISQFPDVGNAVFALAFREVLLRIRNSRGEDDEDASFTDATSFNARRAVSDDGSLPVTVSVTLLRNPAFLFSPSELNVCPRPLPPWGAATTVDTSRHDAYAQYRAVVLQALEALRSVVDLHPAHPPSVSQHETSIVAGAVRVTEITSSGVLVVEPVELLHWRTTHRRWLLQLSDPCAELALNNARSGDVFYLRGCFFHTDKGTGHLLHVLDAVSTTTTTDSKPSTFGSSLFAQADPTVDDASAESLQTDLSASWWVWNAFLCGGDDVASRVALKSLPLATVVTAMIASACAVRHQRPFDRLCCSAETNKPNITEDRPVPLQIGFFMPKATSALLLTRMRKAAQAAVLGSAEPFALLARDDRSVTSHLAQNNGTSVLTELLRLKPHDVDVILRATTHAVVAFSDPSANPSGILPAKTAAWTRRADLVTDYSPAKAAGYQQVVAVREALHFQRYSPHAPGVRRHVKDVEALFHRGMRGIVKDEPLPPLTRSAMLLVEEYFKYARRRCASQVSADAVRNMVLIAQLHASCCAAVRQEFITNAGVPSTPCSTPTTTLLDAVVAVALHDASVRCAFGQMILPVASVFDISSRLDPITMPNSPVCVNGSTVLDVVNRMWAVFRSNNG